LTPNKILLDANDDAKITDFGFAKIKIENINPNKPDTTIGKGSIRWMAPERLIELPTEKADVYSFGVILWQLFTRKNPYFDAHNDIAIAAQLRNNSFTFHFPANTPPQLIQLGNDCLNYNKETRLTAAVVVIKLEQAFPNIS